MTKKEKQSAAQVALHVGYFCQLHSEREREEIGKVEVGGDRRGEKEGKRRSEKRSSENVGKKTEEQRGEDQ